jgi:hypothetical protein
MSKSHPYSRLEFRRRLGVLVRRNLKLVAGLTIGFLASVALIVGLLLARVPASAFRWWLLGALPTAMVAAYLHLLYRGFLAHGADGLRQVRGAWGEDKTRSELQRAKRKGRDCPGIG